MTKGEARKQRQAEHAAKLEARQAAGDFRNASERHSDNMVAQAKARRRLRRRPAVGSLQWAEERGGLIGGYETDDTYCPD